MDPVFSVIKQEMKQALLRQRSRLIPKHPIWVPFRYMARKTGIKLKPGPFYRLLVLFHLILLPPPPKRCVLLSELALFGSFIPGKRCPPQEKPGYCIHHPPSTILGPASQWMTVKREDYVLSRWIKCSHTKLPSVFSSRLTLRHLPRTFAQGVLLRCCVCSCSFSLKEYAFN